MPQSGSHPMIEHDRELIEQELRRVLADQMSAVGPVVFECLHYAVFSGGKRVRPLLSASTARTVGADPRGCLASIATVELLHCASLVIDDLPCMDNDAVRRARRATHVQFGEHIAILTAFALVLLALRLTQRPFGADTLPSRMFQEMAIDSILRQGLISGQEADIAWRRDGASGMNALKTAPLFELACAAGLAGTDVPAPVRSILLAFGHSYGRAFQAKDDVADGDAVDRSDLESGIAECSLHLDRARAMGLSTDYLLPFVTWLQADGVAVDRRGGTVT